MKEENAPDQTTADDPRKVVAAALYRNGITFSKPRPARHNHIINMLHRGGFSSEFIAGCTQGFLLSDGGFADRRSAASVVEMAGQQTRGPLGDELFSEDVW